MKTCGLVVAGVAGVLSVVGSASAAINVYGVSSAGTSTTLFGGDRQLNTLAFSGSSTIMTGADLLRFTNANLSGNDGLKNWSTGIARDMGTSGNTYWANPDRADNASHFSEEGQSKGALQEVFGSPMGYKNLSWIIDGEDFGSYVLDLHLSNINAFVPDANAQSVELAVLERGGNSDFTIQGILGFNNAGPILSAPYHVTRSQTTAAGWNLNTLEIDDSQAVEGVGLSLPQEWGVIYGVRISSIADDNGPDIVAVAMVPTPGSAVLAGLAGIACVGRRRR